MYCEEWIDDDSLDEREHLKDYYNEYPEYRWKSPFDEYSDEYSDEDSDEDFHPLVVVETIDPLQRRGSH
ncbi:hypothetical protein N9189_02025 [Pirellulaceae bacterium]|nr:hypothetical protein [Pirellulaceae bacterium]